MRSTATALQMTVRVAGLFVIALGLLFWSGNADALVPIHMLLGILIVLSLWTLAVLAATSRVSPGLVALAIIWGFIVPLLGLTQTRLLPGTAHWVIQLVHLLVGLGAIGQAENLARRIKGGDSDRRRARRSSVLEGAAR